MLYKPVCHSGFKVSCARTYPHSYDMLRNAIGWSMYQVKPSCWPSLYHSSAPSLDPVCSILCSNCHNNLLARQVILHYFSWHVQCMVHGSRALDWFNLVFFEPVGTSPHPAIWLRKVGLFSSQSELWVDATCSLEIEHPGCAENQVLANHRCSAEHVLLHGMVKYTMQLALQHMFAYTWYNHVFWALCFSNVYRHAKSDRNQSVSIPTQAKIKSFSHEIT